MKSSVNVSKKVSNIIRQDGFKGVYKSVKNFIYFHPPLVEIRYRLKRKIKKEVIKKILDYKMILDLNDPGICKALYYCGIREAKSTQIYLHDLNESKNINVLDVGGNIGYYALMAGKRIDGAVYTLEPDPRNFKLLIRNISINNLNNKIKAYNMAISDREGYIELTIHEFRNLSHVKRIWDTNKSKNITNSNRTVKIPSITIDTFITKENINDEKLLYIRSDIEGYEFFMVKGMKKTIDNVERLKLFLEVHPYFMREYGGEISEFLSFFEDFKLRYYVVPVPPDPTIKDVLYSIFSLKRQPYPMKVYNPNKKLKTLLKDEYWRKKLYNEFVYHLFLES